MEQRFQRCNVKALPNPVILSEVSVGEADAPAVEGPAVRLEPSRVTEGILAEPSGTW